jgi:hypothetical protein
MRRKSVCKRRNLRLITVTGIHPQLHSCLGLLRVLRASVVNNSG